jgi:hypothetical protein
MVLQEVLSMWSAPCPLLGNGSLETLPQKQTRGTIGHLLLGNGALNMVFSMESVLSSYKGIEKTQRNTFTRVEVGSNTSTVTLRVVGGDEKRSLKSETIKYGHEC